MSERADNGANVKTRHENINMNYTSKGKIPMESDTQRKERTGLSSLRISDDESKAVQKTPNRVSLDSMKDKIADEEYIHPDTIPHLTICVIILKNGFALVGKSAPADAENYDQALGEKFAFEDALRSMWPLEAYLLREKMNESPGDRSQPLEPDA